MREKRYPDSKHSDDFWLANAALEHKFNVTTNAPLQDRTSIQRVSDPADADIFIVPALLNLLVNQEAVCDNPAHPNRNRKPPFCCDVSGTQKCDEELVLDMQAHLKGSVWFQRRRGTDHLLVSSHFNSKCLLDAYPSLKTCSLVTFEGRQWSTSFSIPNLYVGKRCDGWMDAHRGWVDAPPYRGVHLLGKMGKGGRDYVCMAVNRLPEDVRSHSVCAGRPKLGLLLPEAFGRWCTAANHVACQVTKEEGRRDHGRFYCDSLIRTPFVLHVPGDTLGSSRLWDAIDNGIIPVLANAEQYDILPFPKALWREGSLMMRSPPSADIELTRDSLEAAIADGTERWAELIAAQDQSRQLLSWTTPGSRAFDMYLESLSSGLQRS